MKRRKKVHHKVLITLEALVWLAENKDEIYSDMLEELLPFPRKSIWRYRQRLIELGVVKEYNRSINEEDMLDYSTKPKMAGPVLPNLIEVDEHKAHILIRESKKSSVLPSVSLSVSPSVSLLEKGEFPEKLDSKGSSSLSFSHSVALPDKKNLKEFFVGLNKTLETLQKIGLTKSNSEKLVLYLRSHFQSKPNEERISNNIIKKILYSITLYLSSTSEKEIEILKKVLEKSFPNLNSEDFPQYEQKVEVGKFGEGSKRKQVSALKKALGDNYEEEQAERDKYAGYYGESSTKRTKMFWYMYQNLVSKVNPGSNFLPRGGHFESDKRWKQFNNGRLAADRRNAKYDDWLEPLFAYFKEWGKEANFPLPRHLAGVTAEDLYNELLGTKYRVQVRDRGEPAFKVSEYDEKWWQVEYYDRMMTDVEDVAGSTIAGTRTSFEKAYIEILAELVRLRTMSIKYLNKFHPDRADEVREHNEDLKRRLS
jgi:hypothetical protein